MKSLSWQTELHHDSEGVYHMVDAQIQFSTTRTYWHEARGEASAR